MTQKTDSKIAVKLPVHSWGTKISNAPASTIACVESREKGQCPNSMMPNIPFNFQQSLQLNQYLTNYIDSIRSVQSIEMYQQIQFFSAVMKRNDCRCQVKGNPLHHITTLKSED